MTKRSPPEGEGGVPAGRPASAQADLPAPATRKLEAFAELIRKWNRYCRLVSTGDLHRLWERHISDSLTLLPWCQGRLVDLGTGAGLPGVPLAIARPDMPVVLVERSERKSRFLRQAMIDLDLGNVELAVADAAIYSVEQSFDTATARALAPPPTAWRLMRRFLAEGGVGLLQSREPLAGTRLDGGELAESVRVGEASWVAVVRRRTG